MKADNRFGTKKQCENGNTLGSTPFCGADTISRIEAVKILLQHSKLWDDTKNTLSLDKSILIADISNTSSNYGYAVKGIQLGILTLGIDKKIQPEIRITQGEAINMAAKVLTYNQCTVNPAILIEGSNITQSSTGLTSRFEIVGVPGGIYRWSMGDGTILTSTSPQISYTYDSPGTYTISVFLYESEDKIRVQNKKISIVGDTDTDADGVENISDICPNVVGKKEKNGCPDIQTGKYGSIISGLLSGADTTTTSLFLLGIHKNACLLKYQNSRGLLIGSPVCDQCPCANRVDILADIRSCDILFPSILSPDFSMMYSRGAFYQIP